MISFLTAAEFTAEVLLPPAAAAVFFRLEKKGSFAKLNPYAKHLLIGTFFGILAIVETEFGIPVNGAQINCRDAAILTAGLIFGAPEGLIACLIGGAERWLAIARGIGVYTGAACTIAAFTAGIFSAFVSRFMLEGGKPALGMSVLIGMSVEVFHMMLIFLFHVSDAAAAMETIQSIVYPMILGNALSVFLSADVILFLMGKKYLHREKNEIPVFETVQKGMTAVISILLVVTCMFVHDLENTLSTNKTNNLLKDAVNDAANELEQQVDRYMIDQCQQVKKDWDEGGYELTELVEKYGLCEIFLVNTQGIVTDCNVTRYKGYDMSKGVQSSEFMCLLHGKAQFVQEYETSSMNEDVQRKTVGISTSDGFLMIAYDASGIYEVVKNRISGIATNRHVAQTGYVVITEMNEKVVSFSSDLSIYAFTRSLPLSVRADTETAETVKIGDTDYYYRLQESSGYQIYALYPVEDADLQRNIAVYLTVFQIIIIFMALFVLLYMIIKNVVVDQVVHIADSLELISSGNLEVKLDLQSNEEFSTLSKDINGTVDALKGYIDQASTRLDAELEMASRIQLGVLPNSDTAFRNRKDFEISAKMDPAKEVGGDFFDFYFTNEDEINIMIADVSGKGIPAAMFMMRAKSTLRDLTESGRDVNEVFTEGNNSLCAGNEAEMFVTAWQAKIHLRTGLVEFANAGHNPPLLRHGNGSFTFIQNTKNPILAAMEDIPYRKGTLRMKPGDILLLYTDGVVEATNASEELYGNQRLLHVLNTGNFESMKDLLMMVRSDVDAFVGEAPQFDDLTLLAFRYNGKSEEA